MQSPLLPSFLTYTQCCSYDHIGLFYSRTKQDAMQLLTKPTFLFPFLVGVVTEGNLMAMLLRKKVSEGDPISAATFYQFRRVNLQTPLGVLSQIFDQVWTNPLFRSSQQYHIACQVLTSPAQFFAGSFCCCGCKSAMLWCLGFPKHQIRCCWSCN